MKLRPRSSKVRNHSSHSTCSRRLFAGESPVGKSSLSTPRWPPCSVSEIVAGIAPRASAHCWITSWFRVTRLRPSRSSCSSGESISCEYFTLSPLGCSPVDATGITSVACLQVRRLLPPRSPRKRLDAGLGRSGRPGRRWRPGPTTPSGLQHDLDAVVLLLLEDLVCLRCLVEGKHVRDDEPRVDI